MLMLALYVEFILNQERVDQIKNLINPFLFIIKFPSKLMDIACCYNLF
ncbi:hypothetical protein CLLU_15640 [Clostridium luticellarii]|jgi:hypothetical protein|uniref:Uncharacterized protein n=1 Tax=Clostridium luticellarii TaxID=1691940 RepID=A0A2T0BNP1_9CLOT|nr:hypothetical protein CLLU_15640 [Clostridium luticellarii]